MNCKKLSVIMPAYNEGSRIYDNLQATSACLQNFCPDFELVVVNDGSRDCTKGEMTRAALKDQHIKIVSYEQNQGKGNAIREGVHAATGDVIAFLDADLDISPAHLKRYLDVLEKQPADIVIGSKMHKDSQLEYPFSRRLVSFCYYIILKTLFRLNVKDTQTGLKVFRAEVIKRIIGMVRTSGYAYDIEILAIAARSGYRIIEQPITLKYTRKASFGRIRLSDILKMAKDTLFIFYHLKIKKLYDAKTAPKEEY
ncbi:MAG: glycosyltransferase family 2 protein [Lachnospiraceae bacterium]|nr:glycosyltransferase family 2 protein [Lachnospiraceae bacterium]